MFFGAEQEFELVVLVKLEIPFLVVGIYQQKTATGLVERIDEPGLYKTQDVAPQMLTLEILANSKSLSPHLNDLHRAALP